MMQALSERYFYALEFCKLKKINRFILADSDLLIYANLTEYFRNEKRAYSHTKTEPDGQPVSPHCSLWSLADIESFVEFLLQYYTNSLSVLEETFKKYKTQHNKGGICDMTLLYLWLKNYGLKYMNTASHRGIEGGVIDHAISKSNNGKPRTKKIKFLNGEPYFIDSESKKMIRVVALHRSGGYKNYMWYYEKNRAHVVVLFITRIIMKCRSKMQCKRKEG